MNRDERKDRGPELPPRVFDSGWIAPLDGSQGGTWAAVSPKGLAACLLNRYSEQNQAPQGRASRGEIIPRLMESGSLQAAEELLDGPFDPSLYSPFSLVLATLDQTLIFQWSSEVFERVEAPQDGWFMLSSSSWKQTEVVSWRRREFLKWLQSGGAFEGAIPAFHLLQPMGSEAWSPLMERTETHTRSITQIRIDRNQDEAVLRYWSCESGVPSFEWECASGELVGEW